MRNDDNEFVFTPPAQSPCPNCLPRFENRVDKKPDDKPLMHPKHLCPYRPAALHLKATGQWKAPTAEQRKRLSEKLKTQYQ